MNILKLNFLLSECRGWPKVKIYLDDDLYEDKEFQYNNETVTIPLDLVDGDHVLIIETYGKTFENTLQDSQGNIIQDQTITLNSIIVDDIVLPEFFSFTGIYKFDDQEHTQAFTWGKNGKWIWPFETPIITWLLNEKIKNRERYIKPEMPFHERLELENKKLNLFNEQLRNLQ